MNLPEVQAGEDFIETAADFVFRTLNDAIRQWGLASLVLSGGGTPIALYRRLAAEPDRLDWSRTHLFWGDERLVAPHDEGSNYGQAERTLIRHIPIPADHVRRMRGDLPAAEAVAAYAVGLREFAVAHDPGAPHPWPRFSAVLLGLGEDGHTASLFPGSPVEVGDPVIAVTADYGGRPAQRITLTPPVFNDARRVIFLVSGGAKANAVEQTLHGKHDPERLPAQRIRPLRGTVHWFLDQTAAGKLG
jgi:6-phosphogluconolactonase